MCWSPESINQLATEQRVVAMPAVTLSGFGTPISSMPAFFQQLSYVNPLRHVVLILRSSAAKADSAASYKLRVTVTTAPCATECF